MEISIGGNRIQRLIAEHGKPIKIELPPFEHTSVSVSKLTSDGAIDRRAKLLKNIKTLEVNPGEPAFRIDFENGTSFWIRIGENCLEILGYSGPPPCLPEETIVPFPQKI